MTSPKILLVDDEAGVRSLFKLSLERKGYGVDTVTDGLAARDRILADNANSYDIIIVDLNLPKLSGFHLIESIQEHRCHDTAKIIVLTAHATKENRSRLKALNIEYVLEKTISLDTIFQSLQTSSAQP